MNRWNRLALLSNIQIYRSKPFIRVEHFLLRKGSFHTVRRVSNKKTAITRTTIHNSMSALVENLDKQKDGSISLSYDNENEVKGSTSSRLEQLSEERERLRSNLPPTAKVLLHSCCAPCSGSMIKELVDMGIDVTILWYNPNIHPKQEYEIRKVENMKYALKLGIPFVDLDYDAKEWYERAVGMEFDPERGRRCTMCFDMRMERTALYAHENGFNYFTTTNATSRWKDVNQVNDSGRHAAEKYPEVNFWEYNWQTDEMTQKKYEISASEKFYKQEYCGCSYSLRDSNLYRKQAGIPPVKIGGEQAGQGNRYFTDPVVDAQEENQEVVDAFFASADNNFDDERRAMYAARKKATTAVVEVAEAGETVDVSTTESKVVGVTSAGAAATQPVAAAAAAAAAVKPRNSLLSMLNNW